MVLALLLAATLSPFDQVVAAERAFAAASLDEGMHAAFLANLAEDSIAFQPLPKPARPAHVGQPPSLGRLTWGPAWVAVSAAGDLALSTGPWQLTAPENPVLGTETTGWFLSVWRRQKDGAWKVAVDAGVSVPMPFAIPKNVENGFAASPAKVPHAKDAATARTEIASAERALAIAATKGIGASVTARADPLLRVYREHKPAAHGLTEARPALAGDQRKMACTPAKVIASASGDLGYSYGTCSGLGADASTKYGFLHVWRKQPDGTWKILVDVTP